MIVACIAAVLAMTGSAFAARALITGADIQNGSITRADLSGRTVRSLKGRRGPAGPAGRDGFAGPQGPQGSTGPQGDRGPAGPTGPQGPRGTTGDTGRQGPKGDQGEQGIQGIQGPPGDTGTPGQALAGNTSFGPSDVGTPIARTSSGPDNTEGTEISNGGIFLPAGAQYKVDVFVSYVDTANPGTEFGVGRLFLDGEAVSPTGNSFGGFGDVDATVVTADIPDDSTNPAQATGSFLVNPSDNGGGGQQLTLRGALRTDDATTTANVTATLIATRIG